MPNEGFGVKLEGTAGSIRLLRQQGCTNHRFWTWSGITSCGWSL